MAKISIPGLRPKMTAKGVAYYWEPSATLKRAGWTSMPLGRDPLEAHRRAEARNKEIEEWRSGGAKPRAVKAYAARATVNALIEHYKAGPFKQLKPTTQKEYSSKFRTISAWAGAEPVLAIKRSNVRTLRDSLMAPDDSGVVRHTMAHGTLRVLRTLLKYAVDELEMIPDNPAERFKLETPPPRDQVASPDARAALETAAIKAGQPNMALAMMLARSTAQRQADLLKLQQSQFVEVPAYKLDPDVHAALAALAPDGRVMAIRIRQGKTSRWIEVPVLGDVRTAIEAGIASARAIGATTILFDEEGRHPWTSAHRTEAQTRQTTFQRRFGDLREAAIAATRKAGDEDLAAELATLQFRDYRRTCVVTLGELGLADQLIAAITGHSLDETKRILETYMPRTTGMAARAIMLSAEREVRTKRKEIG